MFWDFQRTKGGEIVWIVLSPPNMVKVPLFLTSIDADLEIGAAVSGTAARLL